MSVYADVLLAIAPLFTLILVGYLAKKTRLLHFTDAPVLNRFVINITLPAFVFHALLARKLRSDLVQLPFIFWIAEFVMLWLVVGAGKLMKWPGPAIGTLVLQSMYGNTGFIGYPICTALYPLRLPSAVVIDQFGMSIPLYSSAPIVGDKLGTSGSDRAAVGPLQFLKAPVFGALLLGILARLIPAAWLPASPGLVHAGSLVMQIVGLIGGATVPVVLVAVGILLRPSSLGQHGVKAAFVGFFKLIVLPVVVWVIAKYGFHMGGDALHVCVMQAAMPPSATSTVFAGQYDLDGNLAIASFFALTVVSAITLPLMLGVLR